MNLPSLFSTELANQLGWTLVHSLWQGMLLALILAIVLAAMRRRSPRARYSASLAAMAMLLIITGITFHAAATDPAPAVVSSVPTLHDADPLPSPDTASVPAGFPVSDSIGSGPEGTFTALPRRLQPLLPWLAGGWVCGVLLLTLWHMGGWIALQRLKSLGVRPADAAVAAMADRLSHRLGLKANVRVMCSLRVQTPMVLGWLRPIVLIPVAVATGLTPHQIEAILAHELAHVRRHDYLVNLAQVVIETLLFYHPAVWWMSRCIRLEREQCCDDIAVAACGDRIDYVESLAAMEELRLVHPMAMAARGPSGTDLMVRIQRLIGLTDHPRRRGLCGTAACSVLALLLIALAAGMYGGPSATAAPSTDADRTPVIGRVLTAAGAPVRDALVGAYAFSHWDGTWLPAGSGRTREDGTFAIAIEPSANRLVVQSDQGGLTCTILVPGDLLPGETPLVVRLCEASELRIAFLDTQGQPLPGLAVKVERLSTSAGITDPPKDPLIGGMPDNRAWRTDAQGICRIPHLPRGYAVSLRVEDERYAQIATRIELTHQPVTEAPAIRLAPASSIRGRVTLEGSGEPAAGVRVQALGTRADAITDANGAYHLKQIPAGKRRLSVRPQGELAREWTHATSDEIEVGAGEHRQGQDWVLRRGVTVEGKAVEKETGRPLVSITVLARQWPAGPRGDSHQTRTDANGHYALCVPPGTYRVQYNGSSPPPGLQMPVPVAHDVEIGQQALTLNFEFPRLPGVRRIQGQVLDHEGKAVASAIVMQFEQGTKLDGTTLTDKNGNFTLPEAAGEQFLRARKGSDATVQATKAGDEERVVVRLTKGALVTLKGRVTDGAGNGVPASITALSGASRGVTGYVAISTDADGRYTVRDLWPDVPYAISASAGTQRNRPIVQEGFKPGEVREVPDIVLKKTGP